MKRRRPSKHYRVLNTKKGLKRVLVNKHVKPKPKGRIGVVDRRVFKELSDADLVNKEYGGFIDFNKKGRLERFTVTPGTGYEVELPPDYEVQYHTHPDNNVSPPSPEDVVALLNNRKQQAELVFRKGNAFVITDTPRTVGLKKLNATEQLRILYKDFLRAARTKNFEEEWAKALRAKGFLVSRNNNLRKPLVINIVPKEPTTKQVKK